MYQGEHLFPGHLGYFFVALSFGASLLALIAFFFQSYNQINKNEITQAKRWRNLGRTSYVFHGISVVGIIAVLFYLIYNHRFEYHYVWAHSSKTLPVQYMISCFWEGQEGSFLLWTFWNVVLGLVLIRLAKSWEGPVMTVVALAQVTLSSMLLGFKVFGMRIGSNPFILLRDAMPNAPIFQMANYTSLIQDGSGLNPLLQNYWMVIHPPVLFLGFAAVIVPFAYAIASLWKKDFSGWIKPAFPWSIFAVMVLGTGILMGGAWAYEALNFGGFWAWDPVENASLVPWLISLGGLHTMLIFKNRKKGLLTAYLFVVISFLLVLYATFLTRSGILGKSSVHSFTDLGLSGQLLIFIFIFLFLSIGLLATRWKNIPRSHKEDELYSREFWMLIGSFVLAFSAFHITFITSLPVFNKIPGVNMAPPSNVGEHFNKIQLPVAIVIALLTGFAQYLKYAKTNKQQFFKKAGITLAISAIISTGLVILIGLKNPIFIFLLVSAVYTIIGNLDIMIYQLRKKKVKFSGASIAHAGFGLLLLGVLISTSQQKVISLNKDGIDYGKAFDEKNKRESIMLVKNQPKLMSNFLVTYVGDSVSPPNTFYKVKYQKVDPKNLKTIDNFELAPFAQINPDMGGLIASPDTRHYLTRDVYTHVVSVPDKTSEDFQVKYDNHQKYELGIGEETAIDDYKLKVESINPKPEKSKVMFDDYDIATALNLSITAGDKTYHVSPLLVIKDGNIYSDPKTIDALNLKIQFTNIFPQKEKFELTIAKGHQKVPDYIIMKAIIFPYINFLWLGGVVMVIGMLISITRRIRERKKET